MRWLAFIGFYAVAFLSAPMSWPLSASMMWPFIGFYEVAFFISSYELAFIGFYAVACFIGFYGVAFYRLL